MANSFYNSFLNSLLSQANPIDFDTDNIDVALVDNGSGDGAPDAAVDDFWDDQDGGLIDTPYRLVNKDIGSVGPGVFDNTVNPAPAFTTVSGATVESLVFFKNTGTPSSSPLICWFDTATGLPLTPNGGDVNLSFDAQGIFKV